MANFNKWWFLPLGIVAASALIVLGIVFESSEVDKASMVDCSGASATDYACYQKRYQDLVRGSGVKAAFAELKDEYEKNELAKAKCHQLTHVIGRSAFELYGDISGAYSQGEHFCGTGYYHGVMEAIVARAGADKALEEADTLCADLREREEHSDYHYACAHGLGHGFMGVLENELFEALNACDMLTDGWERDHCYNGVFMENHMQATNPGHRSEYLKADQPLYPCTDVEVRYKDQCYQRQGRYVLHNMQQGDIQDRFAKVLDLCATVEDDFRPACYQGLGTEAGGLSIKLGTTAEEQTEYAGRLCKQGQDYEAQSNCVVTAAQEFIYRLRSNAQAKAFCEYFEADLRAVCLQSSAAFSPEKAKSSADAILIEDH